MRIPLRASDPLRRRKDGTDALERAVLPWRRSGSGKGAEEYQMVPRGGIEPSPIQLKVHHFLNGDFPVYLPVDPALSSRPGGCDSVPPYPNRVRVTRYTKKIISAVC